MSTLITQTFPLRFPMTMKKGRISITEKCKAKR